MNHDSLHVLSNKVLTVLNTDLSLKEIIEKVIRLIKDETEYSAIGIRLQDGHDFPYFAQKGFPKDFLVTENSLISTTTNWKECSVKHNKPELECTCGMVISGMVTHSSPNITETGSFWTNNSYPILDIPLDEDPRFHPRNVCIQMGFGSFAIVPIRVHGKIIGTLQLNEKKKDAFTEEDIHYFEDISLAIGSALMRKQTEEILAAKEMYLREVQDIAHIGSYSFDLLEDAWVSSEILDLIFGIPEDFERTFASWLAIVHPDFRETMDEYFYQDVLGARKSFNKEYKIVRVSDKQERWVVGYGSVKYDKQNVPVSMVGTIMDITERKEAEMQRDMVINQLKKRNQDLEQFSYIVSHNLRSPLANLLGISEIVKDRGLDLEELDFMMDNISSQISKLDSMIKDLNYVLQVRSLAEEKMEPVVLADLVERVREMSEELRTSSSILIDTHFDGCPLVFSNKSYLHSIFYNLISNSIKYRKPNGELRLNISSRVIGTTVELEFTDNGIGIDLKAHSNSLFGLYKRFHKQADGKGMGLYMVKTQVESMGGSISVTSEVQIGTTFKILLPQRAFG